MSGLPEIGTKVRLADLGAIGTVERHRRVGDIVTVFVRWPQGGGMWANVNELEVVA